MIRLLTAQTFEIDDVEIAVNEMLDGLCLTKNLLKYSAGLVSCYAEFIESGVLAALCEKLPFDVVGCTTLGNADPDGLGHMMFSIAVLTSDDVQFTCALSESLMGDIASPLSGIYDSIKSPSLGNPSMIFAYLPLLKHIGGDQIIDMMNDITGGIPVFGTVAVDHTSDYHLAQTFLNGTVSRDQMAVMALTGNVSPKFHIASISDENIIRQKAIITASNGNILMEVNNMPIAKYMESLGLAKDGKFIGENSVPFMVDLEDGTPAVARAIFAQTPEGYAVCGAGMPVNATLYVGAIDYADVLRTSAQLVKDVLNENAGHPLIMFSCISRNFALGVDTLAEMETVKSAIPDSAAFQFTYSGGEICPVYDKNNNISNRFHNDTLVICTL